MWLEETISPSTSTSGTTRVSNRASAASIAGSPARAMAEAEVLAHRHVRRAQRADQHVVDELLRPSGAANRSSNGITTSSSTPSCDDQLRLGLEARQQLRRRLRPDHAQRVRLEREHRVAAADHLAVAQVDAVELADRYSPRPLPTSESIVTCIGAEGY